MTHITPPPVLHILPGGGNLAVRIVYILVITAIVITIRLRFMRRK